MPLPERIIQPVTLGSHPLDVSEAEEGTAHLAVASNSLIGALLQLASLVRHADDLFCDISDECQKIFDRSERISKKLSNIEVTVSKLDAKDVTIRKSIFYFQKKVCVKFICTCAEIGILAFSLSEDTDSRSGDHKQPIHVFYLNIQNLKNKLKCINLTV